MVKLNKKVYLFNDLAMFGSLLNRINLQLIMKEYFLLQYKMSNRKLVELGINPLLAYVLGVAGFILISEYLYLKTEFANYAIILTALSILAKTSEISRTGFLLMVFGDKKSRIIRITENLILCLPFSILLIYHSDFLESILLITGSAFLASFSFNTNFNYSLPTPFYKRPFEFTVGFRNTFYIFPVAYVLTIIAISVNNLNLGIFAMLLVFLISFSYYLKPENEYFVWIYSTSPTKFLVDKLLTATRYSAFLALPISVALCAFYPVEIYNILMFVLIGFTFLWTIILAKYSAYPNEINLPEGILIAVCIYFPPLLVFLMPYFYIKSIRKLNALLK